MIGTLCRRFGVVVYDLKEEVQRVTVRDARS